MRQYELPAEASGSPLWLLATIGPEGQASLGEDVVPGQADVCVPGWVRFSGSTRYTSREQFEADAERHRVPADSPYSWQPGTVELFGWEVAAKQALPAPLPVPRLRRLVRSVYQVVAES